jgi:hypothetical protein
MAVNGAALISAHLLFLAVHNLVIDALKFREKFAVVNTRSSRDVAAIAVRR